MRILIAFAALVALSACGEDPHPTGTLAPLGEAPPATDLSALDSGPSLQEELFGPDWCAAVDLHYGSVDKLLEYMNEGNPTGVPVEVEQRVRQAYEDC
jgi:hypothetical protein